MQKQGGYLIVFLALTAFAVGASASAPPAISTYQTEHYRIVYPAGQAWAERVGQVLEETRCDFLAQFQARGFDLAEPEELLSWIRFENRSEFEKFANHWDGANVSWLNEYYSTRTNVVALVHAPWADALATPVQTMAVSSTHVLPSSPDVQELARTRHEAAHQLAFNTGLQRRGVMYPMWVSEGLATNFEVCPSLDNSFRLRRLISARNRHALLPLENFICSAHLPASNEGVADFYAQCWGFFTFLMEKHPAELRAYMKTAAEGTSGRRTLAALRKDCIAAFGSISALEKEWIDFVDGLRAVDVIQQ